MEEMKKTSQEYDEYIAKKIKRYESEINSLTISITELKSDIAECSNKVDNLTKEIEAQEAALHEALKGKVYREKKLVEQFPDTYRAVMWLRENKHLFSGKVFEPMALEINITQAEHAKYFEYIIPKRDLLAFTCEDKNDIQILISKLRKEQNLKINVLHSGQEHAPSQSFVPDIPIQDLRQFGFVKYMKDLVSAPEPIMKYLCRVLRLHNIPIGSEETNDKYEDIPPSITIFCSNDTKYLIQKSKYSGCLVVTSDFIHEAKLLNSNIDFEKIEHIKEKLASLQKDRDGIMVWLSRLQKIMESTEVEFDAEAKYVEDLNELVEYQEDFSN